MNRFPVPLKQVDRVEILTVVDNYSDVLLKSTGIVTRPPLGKEGQIPSDTLLAEHGLSLLVSAHRGEEKHTILFDTGYSQIGALHNLERLKIDLEEIEAVVLSHGHMDHTGSLYPLLEKMPGPVTLVLHPDAFLYPRYFGLEDGTKLLFPRTVVEADLKRRNVNIQESKTPTLIAEDTILITGNVERTTEFEKGLPNALMEREGKIEKDPISDDQALVLHLKGKGLVVISGCSHAGIVNTALFSQKIIAEQNIHAILGGFHLSGSFFEPIIDKTIEALQGMNPEVIVPMHCTGWKAIQRFSEAFPDSFALNSVGSKFTLV
jgi:7,8-dihydropterin-6-yl-methyl-4-(beta-D-ribofuranosyl)aminobenzene 5'-phosphate synthase